MYTHTHDTITPRMIKNGEARLRLQQLQVIHA